MQSPIKKSHEKKYLAGILKYFDRAPRSVSQSIWFKAAYWIITFLLFFALFKLEVRAEVILAVGIAFVIGLIQGMFIMHELTVRFWPIVRPHLNRESIEVRIAELEESEK